MANYDPNDPNKTTVRETYVEPVEKRSSPLPLIIGILLALALAYFVLTRFMGNDDTVAVEEPAATAPAAVEAEAAADNAAAAADNAAEFVSLAIQGTPCTQDTRFGVWFEPLLPRLCPPRDF